MNIKSRLKKVESQIVISDPRFCACDKERIIHLLEPSVTAAHYCTWCKGICRLDKDAPCSICGKLMLFETVTVKPKNEGEENEY